MARTDPWRLEVKIEHPCPEEQLEVHMKLLNMVGKRSGAPCGNLGELAFSYIERSSWYMESCESRTLNLVVLTMTQAGSRARKGEMA